LVSYQHANNVLPCGWSQDGLCTFNALARGISKDRKKHGDKFKKAIKMTIQQQALNSASIKKWETKAQLY
jgi:anti-sigma factor RsiW